MRHLKHGEDRVRALDELYEQVGTYRSGQKFRELLEFQKQFPEIAPFNAMLLHIQRPGSTYVATAGEWRMRFQRTIKPGARPLVILWPFSPVRFVFDLGDTEGDTPFPENLSNPFGTNGYLRPNEFKRLVKNLPRDGVSYHEADHGTNSAGRIEIATHGKSQQFGKRRVYIYYNLIVNQNLTLEAQFATIAHELGHLYCGHLGTIDEKVWPSRMKLSNECQEFEAESVAWLVCERKGIKNPSVEYLSGYLRGFKAMPEISLENILVAAGRIESMLERILPARKQVLVK